MPDRAPVRIKRHRMPKREDTSCHRHFPVIAVVLIITIVVLGNTGMMKKKEISPEMMNKFESIVTFFNEGTASVETLDYCYLLSKELREQGDHYRADYLLMLANGTAPDEQTKRVIQKFVQDKDREERYIVALQNSFHIVAELSAGKEK